MLNNLLTPALFPALSHENVVKIKAVLADQGIIIMEFIREGSLDRYVHSHRDQLRQDLAQEVSL